MNVVALVAALVLFVLPKALTGSGLRMRPRDIAILCAVCVGGGAALTHLALASAGALAVVIAVAGDGTEMELRAVSAHVAPGGQAVRTTSLFLATLQLVLGLRTVMRIRSLRLRAAVGADVGDRQTVDEVEVVVLSASDPVAVANSHGQIIVSDTLLEALDAHEAAVMVRHEAAHFRLRHHRLLALAAIAEATMPRLLTRFAVRMLRQSIERWADDEAAVTHADRATLRMAIRRVCAALRATPAGMWDVEHRLASLARPPQGANRQMHRLGYAAVAAPTIVAAASLGDWASHVVVAAVDAVTLRL